MNTYKNDTHTSTLNGAEEFENQRAKYEEEELDLPDDYDDNERCGCSDPGCPCVGNKKGSL